MTKAAIFSKVIQDLSRRGLDAPAFAPTAATVLRVNAGMVDVQLASTEIINRVPIIGGATVGDAITVKHEGGRYIAMGARVGDAGSTPIIVVGSGGSGGSGVSGTYASGNLIVLDTVSSPGTTIVSVDPTKVSISGGLFSKTGVGALALQTTGNAAAILFTVSGTAAMGAGILTSLTTNNANVSDHTHQIVTTSIPTGNTIVAQDGFGRIGVNGLGIGGAGVNGYALYSFVTSPSFHRGPWRVGGETSAAMMYVESRTMPQLRMGYDANAWSDITTSSTGSMTLFATGPDPAQAHLYFVTAGGLSVGGGQPLARLHVFNTGPWKHLRLAYDGDTYSEAGVDPDGTTTITTFGTVGNYFVNPVGRVGFGKTTQPGAKVEIQSSTTAQQRLSWADGVYFDTTVGSGGNVAFTTHGSSVVWDIQPVGGIAGTKEFRPAHSYDTRLGTPFFKWSELHVGELWIETLVQFNTSTTVNGRLLVTNSSILTEDLPATANGVGNVKLKYPTFAVGDIGRFEGGGKVEWVQCLAGPSGTGPYTYTFARSIDATGANDWLAGDTVMNTGTTGVGYLDLYAFWSSKGAPIEFIFSRFGTTWSANQSGVQAFKLFSTANFPQAGDIQYYGMGGGMWNRINHNFTLCANGGFTGVLEYWNGAAWVALVGATTVAYDATTGASVGTLTAGALPSVPAWLIHDWNPSSQTGWSPTTVNGQSGYWVRWRVTANTSGFATNGVRHVVRGSAQYGPTISAIVRNSNVYNATESRLAIGQLQGQYDYGRSAWGFAAGRSSSTWLGADDFNGVRIMNNIARLGQWDTAGNFRLYGTSGAAKIGLNADGSGFIAGGNGAWDTAGNMTLTASLNVTGGTMGIGENLVYNSTFEVDSANDGIPDGFGVYNNNPGNASGTSPQVPMPSGGIDNGKFYQLNVSIANTGTKGIYALNGTIKRGFKPLQTYVVSWWAKATGDLITRDLGMGLAWNVNPASTVTLANPILDGTWKRFAYKITWGASVDPNLFITVQGAGVPWTGAICIDALQVEEGPVLTYWKVSPSELLPGSISANMISVASLSAISADVGTVYAGDLRLGNQTAANFNASTFTGLRLYKSGSIYRLESNNAGAQSVILDENGLMISSPGSADPSPDTRNARSAVDFGSKTTPTGSLFLSSGGFPTEQRLNLYSIANKGIKIESANSNTAPTASASIILAYQSGTFGGGPSAIFMSADSIEVANPLNAADIVTVDTTLRARDANGFLTPIAIGKFSENYQPTLAKLQANSNIAANAILSGTSFASIVMHLSGQRMDGIVSNAGTITIGYDVGWGAARTAFGGALGSTWTNLGYVDGNWQNVGSPFASSVQYKKVGDLVFVRGVGQRINSTYTKGNAILTLPVGFRPAVREIFDVRGEATGNLASPTPISLRVDVETNGNVSTQDSNINVNGFVTFKFWFSTE